MINKLKIFLLDIKHAYLAYRLNKLLAEEFKYIISQPRDEALILITRWRWDLAKVNMDEKEEAAWEKALGLLEKRVRRT